MIRSPRSRPFRPMLAAPRRPTGRGKSRLLLGNAVLVGLLAIAGCSSIGFGIGIPIGIGGVGVTINSDGSLGGSVGVGVGGVGVGVGGTARPSRPETPASAPVR